MGMAVLGVMVLGALSLQRLPLEFLPTFSSSSVWVRAPYPSSSPEETERRIVRPLEDILGTINGIETMSATASAEEGSVSITFVDGTDMDMAAVEVRDRIDRVRDQLPDDLRRVFIRRFQTSDIPMLRFHVSADWKKDRLYEFIEQVIQRRLERLDGVAQVDVRGLLEPQVQVDLVPARMRAMGIDARDVASAIRDANRNVSGGYIDSGSRRLLVRSLGELRSLSEIRDLPIDGGRLKLSDIADVRRGYPKQEEFNFLNGKEAVTARVYKTSTANLLEVADAVKAELAEIRNHPDAEGLELRVYRDSSEDVRNGLGQLASAGAIGGLLAIVFLYLFLRKFRTTLLIGLAIPISIVLTFVIMYLLRQAHLSTITLNIMSLMGLMLALGMLVDNSVVVIESIFRHVQDLGEDARTAALHGTSAVAMPIVASTLTTICVFVPLIFLASSGGGFMRFLTDVGVTIVIVMVSSLLVALTVVPMTAAFLLRGETTRRSGLVEWMSQSYGRLLGWSLNHRGKFFVAAAAILWGAFTMLSGIERTFSPRSLERQVALRVETPRSYSLDETRATFEEAVALLDSRREPLEIADVAYEYQRGGRPRRGWRGGNSIDIFLKPEEESRRSTREIQNEIRGMMPVKAGVVFKIQQGRGHGGGSGGITIEVSGEDMAVLALVADNVAGALEDLPWVKDVSTSLESGDEEIHVTVRRDRASQTGLSSQAVGSVVASALSTRPVTRLKTDEREVDLVMQYREEDRRSLSQLKTFAIGRASEAQPISAVADFSVERGPLSISREDRRPKLQITANTASSSTSFRMLGEVRTILAGLGLPPGYDWSFGRWERFASQHLEGVGFAIGFALLLVYMIMASLFESFVQPLVIMFSIPFAIVGVGLTLRLTGQPLDTNANLGLIILLGVVVNNAIVLIDHINHLRWQGLSRREAIVQGGRHRLRPILMTALTTILGLLPMVAPLIFPGWLGQPEGQAANWAPTCLVILGGLTTSTFLTLLIIPTVYTLVDDMAGFSRRVVYAA